MADSQDAGKTFFDYMLRNWPDQDTARAVLDAVHRLAAERASGPPVVNVTLPGVPGHFTGIAGQGGAAYVPASPHPLT